MSRRVLVGAAVVLLFVGVGAGVAWLTRDDSSDSTATSTSTSTSTSASITTTTTTPAATTTTEPATTSSTAPAPQDTGVPDLCGAEGATIKAAIDHGVDGAANAQVDQCRLAAVDQSWAAVRLTAKPGADFAAVTVLLHGGGGSWAIVGSGPANVGCGAAPQQVLVDLGIVCSSAGGGGGL